MSQTGLERELCSAIWRRGCVIFLTTRLVGPEYDRRPNAQGSVRIQWGLWNWNLYARGSTLWLLRRASLLVLLLSSFLRAAGSATLPRLTDVTAIQGIVYFQASQRIHS
jgi:hypothetical protein